MRHPALPRWIAITFAIVLSLRAFTDAVFYLIPFTVAATTVEDIGTKLLFVAGLVMILFYVLIHVAMIRFLVIYAKNYKKS